MCPRSWQACFMKRLLKRYQRQPSLGLCLFFFFKWSQSLLPCANHTLNKLITPPTITHLTRDLWVQLCNRGCVRHQNTKERGKRLLGPQGTHFLVRKEKQRYLQTITTEGDRYLRVLCWGHRALGRAWSGKSQPELSPEGRERFSPTFWLYNVFILPLSLVLSRNVWMYPLHVCLN